MKVKFILTPCRQPTRAKTVGVGRGGAWHIVTHPKTQGWTGHFQRGARVLGTAGSLRSRSDGFVKTSFRTPVSEHALPFSSLPKGAAEVEASCRVHHPGSSLLINHPSPHPHKSEPPPTQISLWGDLRKTWFQLLMPVEPPEQGPINPERALY